MQFLFDGMAQSLAISAFVPDLANQNHCRAHLLRMGWAIDRIDAGTLKLIIDRAREYRAQMQKPERSHHGEVRSKAEGHKAAA